MAKAARARARKSAAPEEPVGGSLGTAFAREAIGVSLLGLACFAALAVWSHAPHDPLWSSEPVANRGGRLGAILASTLVGSLGLASYLVVGLAALLGARLIAGLGLPSLSSRAALAIPLLLAPAAAIPPLLSQALPKLGGLEGGALGDFLAGHQAWLLGSWGALLANALVASIGFLAVTGFSVGRALGRLGALLGVIAGAALALVGEIGRALGAAFAAARRGVGELTQGIERGWSHLGVWREQRARRARVAAQRGPEPEEELTAEDAAVELTPATPAKRAAAKRERGGPQIVDHAEERSPKGGQQESFQFREQRHAGPYQLPDVSIFQEPPRGARTYDRDSLIMNSRILEKKLQDFGVGGSVVKVHPGPVITMYEFEPASGIKVNKIVGLADDLALALRALSVRIIAPLPGKSVVGVEVANAERETVYLRDLLECEKFRGSEARLPVALGKDIFGNPADADLAKMPHLLVAGATGTGKSVFLNSLLCSVLCRRTPDELKLLLIDPKLLELSIYAGIPHLIADVVTNPKRASAALAGIVRKMEERYQLMAALGVRSIQQYNERCEKELAAGKKTFRLKAGPDEEEGVEVPFQTLPYIVVVIDELADLMVVCAKDVEESLQRLAQMARAAGIHLVLATQRPSVDVLTGVIKANFPARISFQVSSRTDSRTILDQNGADHLLGSGDMLFLPPGTSKMQRLHGAFVTEDEVGSLTGFLQEQGAPSFDEDLVRIDVETEERGEEDEDVDEMYDRAVQIVAETRNASISYVQRRLKIGYNRAARIVEHMEREGVVGPQMGTKPREVFVSPID
ncbi:MAG: DNA translocase FtsK 4TM domain-containing protein [Myxococcota bacterium]